MTYSAKIVVGILIAGTCLILLTRRPVSVIGTLHTPDAKHIHQVSKGRPLTQEISDTSLALTNVSFWIDATNTPSDAVATLSITKLRDNANLRTVSVPFSSAIQARSIAYFDEQQTVQEQATLISFPVDRLHLSRKETYALTLSASDISPSTPLRIRYQSDSEKFPVGTSYSSDGLEQGNLGFVLDEQPTIATLITRWMLNARNVLIWPAILALVLGGGFWYRYHSQLEATSRALPNQVIRTHAIWIVGLIVAAICIYWPTTNLFYYHDDVPLLARVKHFEDTDHLWRIISAHDYIATDIDKQADFGFFFWRPVSAGLYTWFAYHAFGTHAEVAHFINIVLIGLTAAMLYILGIAIFQQKHIAFFTAIAWLTHSTKIGVAYWWSAVQNILASGFSVLTILIYISWRANPKHRGLLVVGLGTFALAALSKEHAFVLPVILLGLEIVLKKRWQIKQVLARIAPFICIAGLLLAARTIALGDPTLPHVRRIDTTYATSATPQNILHNVLVYATWSAEHWVWPEGLLEGTAVESGLRSFVWRSRLQAPIYPGILLLASIIVSLFYLKKSSRKIFLFGILWWLVFLTPQLLLANDWRFRWLYLPIFGLSIMLGTILMRIPKRYQVSTTTVLAGVLMLFGFWHARLPERTQFFTDQAAYSQTAFEKYTEQVGRGTANTSIYLVGISDQQTTSVTAYLFRLIHPYYPFTLIRSAAPPTGVDTDDIIIDMSGIDAYYPEHER